MINPNPKNAPEEPKKQLPGNEKKSLEKDQEDQSNHYK
jgi:hypothetical protein